MKLYGKMLRKSPRLIVEETKLLLQNKKEVIFDVLTRISNVSEIVTIDTSICHVKFLLHFLTN